MPSGGFSVLDLFQYVLSGFQVIPSGRFWVIAEAKG